MIKDFENFTKIQHFGNGSWQWEKKYPDGNAARTCVDDLGCTRKIVREAFEMIESEEINKKYINSLPLCSDERFYNRKSV